MSVTVPRRRTAAADKAAAVAVWSVVGVCLLVGLVVNVAQRVAGPDGLGGPFTVTFGTFGAPGVPHLPWTTGHTVAAAATVLALTVPLVVTATWWARRRRTRKRVDSVEEHLAGRHDLRPITRAGATDVARQLGAPTDPPGLFLADTLRGEPLVQDYESTSADIWSTRRGKSTSRVIPGILDAPGWVLTTSSRRDTHDATRGLRERVGRVHVFDPQGVVGEKRGMWWNPLSFVTSGPLGPEVKAQALADIFAASAVPADSRQDAFFDGEGTELLGHFLLAAAVSGKTLRDVYLWVTNPSATNTEPARILTDHGYPLSAAAVREAVKAPEKQRGGVFGAAKRRIWWLIATSAHDWITPQPGPQFNPAAFVRSTDTLYLLSRGGKGSLAALTSALAAAVCEAAEQEASQSPRGRLRTPGAVILDEVGNTVRGWTDLPEKFSYYGGSGILLMVMLQSWAQGEKLWGPGGMAQLWSSANIRVYGGGSAEAGFLRDLSELAGSYRPTQLSDTASKDGRSVSRSEGKERVLSISDLTGLPKGRVLIFAGLPRPVLAVPRPWMDDPRADDIRASIRRFDPAAESTLHVVEKERFTTNPDPAPTPAPAR